MARNCIRHTTQDLLLRRCVRQNLRPPHHLGIKGSGGHHRRPHCWFTPSLHSPTALTDKGRDESPCGRRGVTCGSHVRLGAAPAALLAVDRPMRLQTALAHICPVARARDRTATLGVVPSVAYLTAIARGHVPAVPALTWMGSLAISFASFCLLFGGAAAAAAGSACAHAPSSSGLRAC